MTKTVAELLREAAAALEQVPSSNAPVASLNAPERRNNAPAEVLRLFSPYPARGVQRKSTSPATMTKKCKKTTYTHAFICLAKRKDSDIPTPAAKRTLEMAGLGESKITFPDKYCGASDFSDHLELNFPQLKYCGGFQLLRSRGSTRSKVLEIIPCPPNGYTSEGLSSKELGVGAAVIYIRPLQKDIDMQDPPSLTLTPQTTGPLVECVYCAEIFSFSEIQGHNDCCEK
ncbi:hypothetical protein AMECASPLE_026013 [Ameca splendens]|uniref:Uncharacterized protein n=1 Tax=Ameca splendens TaxID=208324 RepID=A0ABV0Z2T0_9TELE